MSSRKSTTLDVRPILANGEDPFAVIRGRVDVLKPGEDLTILAPFLPAPLIELLKSEGFTVGALRNQDGSWRVNFSRE